MNDAEINYLRQHTEYMRQKFQTIRYIEDKETAIDMLKEAAEEIMAFIEIIAASEFIKSGGQSAIVGNLPATKRTTKTTKSLKKTVK